MSKIKITAIKSVIDRPMRQKNTMKSLGLKKMHQSIELEATPQVQGMIKSVQHLLKVETIKK